MNHACRLVLQFLTQTGHGFERLAGWLDARTQRCIGQWNDWNRDFATRFASWIRRTELLAALLLILASSVFFFQMEWTMANASLQADEFGTIRGFSSRGPAYVFTHYGLVKNHIFFNLVNSLTPDRKDYTPWRARLWSLVANAGIGAMALGFLMRRKLFLEGALFFSFWATSQKLMELDMMARGYGFLAFFTVAGGFLLWRYFEKPGWLPAGLLGLCVALGTYSVPHYLIYGGTLLLLLFACTLDWRVGMVGVLTALLIGLLYLPVASQMLRVVQTYPSLNEDAYRDFNALYNTFSYYQFQQKPWIVLVFLSTALMAPFGLWPRKDPAARSLQLLTITSFFFLIVCLKLETPPHRTTGFINLPLLLIAVLAAGRIYRLPSLAVFRPVLALGITIPLAFGALHRSESFTFTPKENFLQSSKIIRAIFPPGLAIYVNERPDKLQGCLPADYLHPADFDRQAYLDGTQVMLDSDFRAKKRFASTDFTSEAIDLQVPQSKGGFQTISFLVPKNQRLVPDLSEPGRLQITPINHLPVHSLNLFFRGKNAPARLQIVNHPDWQKRLKTFPVGDGILFSLPVDGVLQDPVSFSANPAGKMVAPTAVWTSPAAWPATAGQN